MALARPALIFPDVAAWAIGYLDAALDARAEGFASGVTVAGYWTGVALPARLVTVRDDGGPREGPVTKRCTLAVNVWAATQEDCTDLALLVAALLEDTPGVGAVVAHDGATGPVWVPDNSGRPHRYLTADLVVRGADL